MTFIRQWFALALAIETFQVSAGGVKYTSIAAIQPAYPRLDIFGTTDNGSIWHKSDSSSGKWSEFEILEGTSADSSPVVTSWGEKRLDVFYTDGGAAYHTYTGNGGRQWAYPEDLESPKFDTEIAAVARDTGYIDLFGSEGGAFYYKGWDENADSSGFWANLGGYFSSAPAIASWGPDRLDVIGIDSASHSIFQKFAYKASPDDTKLTWAYDWVDLGGGPFIGDPFVSTWGPGRLDIWAIGKDGQLNHKYLQNRGGDWWEWSAWEQLGGNFDTAPTVVSWTVATFTIVGKFKNETQYRQKDLYDGGDGNWWHPSVDGWFEKKGTFVGEPAVVAAKGSNWVYIFGVEETGNLGFQLFDSTQWLPASDDYYSLGDLTELSAGAAPFLLHQDLKA